MQNPSGSDSGPGVQTLPPRPTVYDGVLMRSRLEAGFAAWADSMGLGPLYEPQAFATSEGQYLPDFLIRCVAVEGVTRTDDLDSLVWVEVKPYEPTGRYGDELRARMEIIHASLPDAVLAVAFKDPTPGLLVKRGTMAWRRAVWSGASRTSNVGIAFPLGATDGPWAHGYWKGPEE